MNRCGNMREKEDTKFIGNKPQHTPAQLANATNGYALI